MKKNHLIGMAIVLLTIGCTENKPMEPIALYVGTYTDSGSEGIYRYAFDPQTGSLAEKTLAANLPNPSFLKISNDHNFLYAVQETDKYDSLEGGVSAFKINNQDLQVLNTQGSGGENPCHIGISKDGKMLAVSNYTGGNLAVFQLKDDGSLSQYKQLIDHKILDSTKTSHVHSAEFTSDGLFAADLGLDAVKRYRQTEAGFVEASQPSLDLSEGAGPRHFAFGQEGKFLYVINELNSTITVFKRNSDATYAPIITHSTVAADFKGESFCADIHLSPDGMFLYGSNRGENTIVVFAVNQKTGDLAVVERAPVKGDWPRNFTVDPSGKFLLVANQRSNNITVFARDEEKGTLTFLHETALSSPVCLEFAR
ncbi:lactonase family protein [Aggregatimonas sangjinii]|uniref:Lactonase family protein n=1 Tax=Aggregatimonas sangjinii TaxID=2583587 RepID=A0A5B7SXT0_9FLAO|nr:lactonase family protein [Aggregatimonas sangjinii]QCX01540.1 lactonase family protein [Aggregatimonas sangjinii]